MANSASDVLAIPYQYIYDGMVIQGNFFPKETLDRIKTLELYPSDVLLPSIAKTGKSVYGYHSNSNIGTYAKKNGYRKSCQTLAQNDTCIFNQYKIQYLPTVCGVGVGGSVRVDFMSHYPLLYKTTPHGSRTVYIFQ